jgi:hypothetical protein
LILPNNLIPYLFRKKRAPTVSRTLTRCLARGTK